MAAVSGVGGVDGAAPGVDFRERQRRLHHSLAVPVAKAPMELGDKERLPAPHRCPRCGEVEAEILRRHSRQGDERATSLVAEAGVAVGDRSLTTPHKPTLRPRLLIRDCLFPGTNEMIGYCTHYSVSLACWTSYGAFIILRDHITRILASLVSLGIR